MPPRPPKDPATIGSFAELRSHYKVLYGMLEDCHKMKGMTHEALRYRRESLFQHEAVIGVLQVAIGTVLAAAMRPLH